LSYFYLVLLLLWCALLTWRPLYGYSDFWAHAAVGRWIYQHGRVPDRTLFLWTADEPWVYHSWLSQLVFYGLTCLADGNTLPYVVLGFTAVMVALPFVLAWDLWGRRGRISAWVILPFFFALHLSYLRFLTRPELFTVVFLALLIRFLVAWSAGAAAEVGRADKLWAAALLPLFAVWANCHGGVVVGLLLLGVTAACDLVQDRFRRRSRVLALLVPLAVLAVLANPYGWGYWQAYRTVGGKTFRLITEWAPLWEWPDLPDYLLAEEAALLGLALLAWALNPSRRWAHLAWLVLMTGLFVDAVRNAWMLAVVCLLVTAANAGPLDPERLWQALERGFGRRPAAPGRPSPPYLRWLVRGGLVAWLLMQVYVRWVDTQIMGTILPQQLSAGAVRFFQENRLPGHGFNDYENASYFHWRLAGEPPFFIDTLNAYPEAVTRDYVDIMRVSRRGRELLAGDWLDWVLLTTNRPGPSAAPLADYLDGEKRWMRIYAGGDGVIWVRRTPEADLLWGGRAATVDRTGFAALETFNKEPMW
jgi:hypothetical protein